MSRVTLLWIVLALWLVAMAVSGLSWTAEPTGDGFTRGLNRLTGFLGAQLVASVLALCAWLIAQPFPRRSPQRWLGRVPGWWAITLLLIFIGTILFAMFSDPRPPDGPTNLPTTASPDQPTTAAPDLQPVD